MFLGCPELAWRRKMASHFSYLTLRQSSTNPKNIDARFSKSLMRINVGASIATSYPMAKLADNKTARDCHWRVLRFATRVTRDLWRQNLPITKLRFVIPNLV